MNSLLVIDWNVDPTVFPGLGWDIPRWYGVMWALGFALSYVILKRMVRKEGYQPEMVDTMLIYVLLGAVIGARVGHMFFYETPVFGADGWFTNEPLRLLKIWEGGLASHGGAIGIIIAVILMTRKWKAPAMTLWTLDRLVVVTAMTGFFIRLGNLFNHEIVGDLYDGPMAFEFDPQWCKPCQQDLFNEHGLNTYSKCGEDLQGCHPPGRHPAQLYEAIAYLAIFGALMWMYLKTQVSHKMGRLLGWFLVMIFTARFCIEFIKVGQADRDADLMINTGQMLSIPFVLIGIFLIVRPTRKPPSPGEIHIELPKPKAKK